MDYKRDKNSGREELDGNIKRLLKSALSPEPAATFFKRGLLIHLKDELLSSSKGEWRQQERPDALEENLSRLMAAAGEPDTQVVAKPGFKERLRYEVVTAGAAAERQRRLNVLSPAFVTAVVGVMLFMVLVFGVEVYPNHWADSGTEVATTMIEGTGVATETRPLFFGWGTRTTKSSLASGETVSLSAGDKITVASGKAVIDLFNGSSIKLYPGSVLDINELEPEDEQGTPFASTFLETGKTSIQINDFSYELATPSTVATVLGTTFQAEVISADHTYLATGEGTVELTMNGDTVEVNAGEEVDAVQGEKLKVKEASAPKLVITNEVIVFSPDIVLTGETDIDAEVTVNDIPVPVNTDGTFSVKLRLIPGLNEFVVIATNPAGISSKTEQRIHLI